MDVNRIKADGVYLRGMRCIYDLGIALYRLGIGVASLWTPKAKAWIKGRRDLWMTLHSAPKGAIWVHCASLGEFEQGRPLIEAIKARYPEERILLTFFSPSGYALRKDYPQADAVHYLPLDTPRNARRWVAATRPKMVIFVKYEFWHHHIAAVEQAGIPIYAISARFRAGQRFFQWYGGWFRQTLARFDHLFVQDAASVALLSRVGITQATAVGDTRVDRVWAIRSLARIFPQVESFAATHKPILVAGSTWLPDERLLSAYCKRTYPLPFKLMVAPHDVSTSRIEEVAALFPQSLNVVRYSQAQNFNLSAADVLIVDNIGLLSSLYRYGRWAYVGGAFGRGLHNTLEPIAFGLPVVFGKRYEKFEEAQWLVEQGGGFSVRSLEELVQVMEALQKEEVYQRASQTALRYIEEQRGVTDRIIKVLLGG